MAKKRKYDTEALVGQIKRERRISLALTFGGVFILCFIVGIYIVHGDRFAPEPTAPIPAAPSGPSLAALANPAPSAPPAAVDPPAPEQPASLTISINKPAVVFLDGKRLGKVAKKKKLDLPAGRHTVSIKVGKKSFEQALDLASGEVGEVTIDVKKRKLSFKKS